MTKGDFFTIKAHFYPSVNVVDSITVDEGIETLEANSTVDTGGRVFTTDEKHHSLATSLL